MRGIVCERISKNRYRVTAFHYGSESPVDVYRKCEILNVARRWQQENTARDSATETMFSRGTLQDFGRKIEKMIHERVDKWDSRTDA